MLFESLWEILLLESDFCIPRMKEVENEREQKERKRARLWKRGKDRENNDNDQRTRPGVYECVLCYNTISNA